VLKETFAEMPMPAVMETIEATKAEDKDVGSEQDAFKDRPPTSREVRGCVRAQMENVLELVEGTAGTSEFETFEPLLVASLWRLARLLIVLFLCLWHERLEEQGTLRLSGYRRKEPKARLLGTLFGHVRYWRLYMHKRGGGGGCYPLDERLGLLADGFSIGLLGRAVQLATKMSYEASAAVLASFLGWAPSKTSIEEATLGLGCYTQAWFEQAPPPADEGDVLVIEVDSKATPTATAEELAKRRRPRPVREAWFSPRHRGRGRRERWGPKKQRAKDDKRKNGRMTTIVVMYSLRRTKDDEGKPVLMGPLNRWQYASYAAKRVVLAVARREADKRGFGPGSGKLIQIVTDGDEELQRGVQDLFPEARHTLDVCHALEYLHEAAGLLHRKGSATLSRWVQQHKEHLYAGDVHETVMELDEAIERLKSRSKRKRLAEIAEYLAKRVDMMNYDDLCEQDLELGSGAVEGAVRYVISQRFDEGGMRWIPERAEPLLQLRCIELNGHWTEFLAFAHRKLLDKAQASGRPARLLRSHPQPLPNFALL
jgi:hypothetical protein